jgi:hypothetical protein
VKKRILKNIPYFLESAKLSFAILINYSARKW